MESTVIPSMKCLVCKQEIGCFPDGALIFQSTGNYGSAIFDPGPGGGLKLVVCIHDKCVKENLDAFVGMQIRATQAYDVYMGAAEVLVRDS
jgi:hypothetical protein